MHDGAVDVTVPLPAGNPLLEHHALASGELTSSFVKVPRRTVFGGRWHTVFSMMQLLGLEFGASHVRLVVWFDS